MNFKKYIIFILLLVATLFGVQVFAQVGDADVKTKVEISLSPRAGSFVAGSTFEVPVLINTNNLSINAVDIKVNFDHTKLSVVEPSGGKSVVSFWTESAKYNNLEGTVSYVGTINEGLVTESGLIAMITFKALSLGSAVISINPNSQVILDDDLDTKALLDLGRVEYNILIKVSEGVPIFSETHPSENKWYNNNNPVISWGQVDKASGFSFILDNKPFTIPDNVADSNENTTSYENLSDGLWYFHVKPLKDGAWGNTGHFMVKIDTAPPASFIPKVNSFSASAILHDRSFVSFFTTDNLSGVDHYEVGTIDNSQPISDAPVFIEASSPFQVPILEEATLKVIVRAIDRAGNVQEGYVEVDPPIKIVSFIKNNFIALLLSLLLLVLAINYFKKYGIIRSRENSGNFSELEQSINTYIGKKKERDRQNMLEREKIQILEKDLESIKNEIPN